MLPFRARFVLILAALFVPTGAFAQTLRVVSWNTANDVGPNGTDTHAPTVGGPASTVFAAMAALNLNGNARPIDVLALQESVYHSGGGANPTAVGYVNALNAIYGSGTYAAAPVNGTTSGALPGNGPQTLVYRTTTVQLLAQAALGTPSGSGIPRQVMRYTLKPVGGNATSAFTLFNNHFKAGTGASDDDRRGIEATVINTAANALPANAPIIYAGDYNPTNNVADQGYQGVVSNPGTNRAVDPLNPTNVAQSWHLSSFKAMATASPATTEFFDGQGTGGMHYRDDFLLNSPGILSGSNGIQYADGTFTVFGNTGTHTYLGGITTGSSSAFAADLNGYSSTQAAAVLAALAQSCDHLPVVADYRFTPVPEPGGVVVAVVLLAATLRRRRVSELPA